ncbi:hypothetical protein Clacol_006267 [Clathrus columnatus]|uniref:Galactose-1-phosphate uridylyltransferase n=1 Tax=Clathrus columnatus TaxID=1419009 RepID=A0AAV5AEF9_9AGAM|nr:hypothetical protein Clacol_006267 [Clathrus columnatus]
MAFDPDFHPHRRSTIVMVCVFELDNPLTKEYILVSPHRNKRPWLGQTEPSQPSILQEYDPKCYLCPGNSRSGGQLNETYVHTSTFENDFPALLRTPCPETPKAPHPLLSATPLNGVCDVIIFHPRHDLTLARLTVEDIRRVIEEWCSVYLKRGSQENIKYVQIFENKGAMMGCSNPHPHGQVWSLSQIPELPRKELHSLLEYATSPQPPSDAPKDSGGRPNLLLEYAHFEASVPIEEGDGRTVIKNEHWLAVVPWWAIWPFEMLR